MQQPREIIKIEMPIPEEVQILHGIFTAADAKLFLVGGCVRDFLKGIIEGKQVIAKDHDLVTDKHPDMVVDILKKDKRIRIREVGKSFGVVLAILNNVDFEIATFREDSKTSDGRRPDYVVFSTIEKDAERRDLTINALYYDIKEHCILDFFGGIQDLWSKKVRFVGDALARITEDKLRVLRFVRFHCRNTWDYGESVDKDTKNVIKSVILRPEISDERIRDEFLKGLASCLDVRSYIGTLDELNLLQQVFPGLNVVARLVQSGGIFPHGTSMIPVDSSMEAVVAQILRYNDPGKAKDALLELKYTAQEATNISFLLRIPTWTKVEQFVEFKKALKRTSLDFLTVENRILLCGDDILHLMLQAPYPTVRGEQVIAETNLQGKALGDEILRREIENFRIWMKPTS